MPKTEHEIEFAFEWRGDDFEVVDTIKCLKSWKKSETRYTIKDTIYDTLDNSLANNRIGVRMRTEHGKTTLTAKKFLGKGLSGEGLYDECHESVEESIHPTEIYSDAKISFIDPGVKLVREYELTNRRHQIEFTNGTKLVRVINEQITYSNTDRVASEALLEVEFEGDINQDSIAAVKDELLTSYPISHINEGKTDRAKRLLGEARDKILLNNLDSVKKQSMRAHGGNGLIDMWFFHQSYSRFDEVENIQGKVSDYKSANWDFFAYAELPPGSDVKYHKHDKTDEIYFILSGRATITVDGVSSLVREGDCILTRKGSSHSLTDVSETLKFVAIEIYR